jgi:hypothetical protein
MIAKLARLPWESLYHVSDRLSAGTALEETARAPRRATTGMTLATLWRIVTHENLARTAAYTYVSA